MAPRHSCRRLVQRASPASGDATAAPTLPEAGGREPSACEPTSQARETPRTRRAARRVPLLLHSVSTRRAPCALQARPLRPPRASARRARGRQSSGSRTRASCGRAVAADRLGCIRLAAGRRLRLLVPERVTKGGKLRCANRWQLRTAIVVLIVRLDASVSSLDAPVRATLAQLRPGLECAFDERPTLAGPRLSRRGSRPRDAGRARGAREARGGRRGVGAARPRGPFRGAARVRHGRPARQGRSGARAHEPAGGRPRELGRRLARPGGERGRRAGARRRDRLRRKVLEPALRRGHRGGARGPGRQGAALHRPRADAAPRLRGQAARRRGRRDGDGEPQPAAGQRLQGLPGDGRPDHPADRQGDRRPRSRLAPRADAIERPAPADAAARGLRVLVDATDRAVEQAYLDGLARGDAPPRRERTAADRLHADARRRPPAR